jgi:hypothetical protein
MTSLPNRWISERIARSKHRQHRYRMAAYLQNSMDPGLAEAGHGLERWIREGGSLAKALGLLRGGVRAVGHKPLRNDALHMMALTLAEGANPSAAARKIHDELKRFKFKDAEVCPERLVGAVEEWCWYALHHNGGKRPSERTIYRALTS